MIIAFNAKSCQHLVQVTLLYLHVILQEYNLDLKYNFPANLSQFKLAEMLIKDEKKCVQRYKMDYY